MLNISEALSEAIEPIRAAVRNYRGEMAEQDKLKAAEAVQQAVSQFKAQVDELEKIDRGATQQAARDLTDVLAEMPELERFLADKKALSKLHTRQLALAHIEMIEEHLKHTLGELGREKQRELHAWARKHPVFGPLRKLIPKKSDDCYVLLFERGENDALQLITSESNDGRVFTRWRTREFSDDIKLHKTFSNRAPVVGGAVIQGDNLLGAIGDVPGEGEERLKTLKSLSKAAANQPIREFLESHPVLQSVHELCRKKKLPRDAYILLFESTEDGAMQIIIRYSDEEKVITRFRAHDFSDPRAVLDRFRDSTVCGAAVINGSELTVFGEVPQPQGEQTQLQVLNAISAEAADRPTKGFLSGNTVLAALHEFAAAQQDLDRQVILFSDATGHLAPLDAGHRIALIDFRNPRMIHTQFAKLPSIVGASVIGQQTPHRQGPSRPGGDKDDRDRPRHRERDRDRDRIDTKPVVVQAFGRTPLKQSMLLTPDILRRMGMEDLLKAPVRRPHDIPRREGQRSDAPRKDGPRKDGPRKDGPRKDGPRKEGPRKEGQQNEGPPAEGGRDKPAEQAKRDRPRRQRRRRGPRPEGPQSEKAAELTATDLIHMEMEPRDTPVEVEHHVAPAEVEKQATPTENEHRGASAEVEHQAAPAEVEHHVAQAEVEKQATPTESEPRETSTGVDHHAAPAEVEQKSAQSDAQPSESQEASE